jgi:hypothetical protein
MAQNGASYVDILTHYYTGVSVGDYPDPGVIEVGVETGRSSVSASGSFSIVDGRGKTIVREALGTWNFVYGGSGAVSIQPPQGYGLPLEVGIVNAPKKVLVGEPAFLTVALSRPAKVSTQTERSPTGYRDPGVEVKDAGRRKVVWLAPLEEGKYRVRVQARAGPSRERSEPVEIQVTSARVKGSDPADGSEPYDPQGTDGDAPPVIVFVVFAALLILGLAAVLRGRSGSAPE